VSFSPVRLNHAVLFVTDLERSERFYHQVFGMEIRVFRHTCGCQGETSCGKALCGGAGWVPAGV